MMKYLINLILVFCSFICYGQIKINEDTVAGIFYYNFIDTSQVSPFFSKDKLNSPEKVYKLIINKQKHINYINYFKNIEYLSISNCNIEKMVFKDLQNLKILRIDNVKGIKKQLSTKFYTDSLISLYILNSNISSCTLQDSICSLRSLYLNNCIIDDSLVFVRKPNLLSLSLHALSLNDFPIDIVNLKNLRQLVFSSCLFKEIPENIFSDMPKLKYLSFIDMDLNFQSLSNIINSNINHLSFESCKFNEFPYVLGEMNNLKSLEINNNKINKILECPIGFYKLQSLVISQHPSFEISECFIEYFKQRNVFLFYY